MRRRAGALKWTVVGVLLAVGSAALALCAAAAPAAAAPDARVQVNRISEVAARGDTVVSAVLGAKTTLRFGFETAAARIQRPGEVFDLDLGTGLAGEPRLVYARCRQVSPRRACDVYGMDLSSLEERKLSVSRRRCIERAPALSGGVLVFVRERRAARKRRKRCAGGVFVRRPGAPPARLRKDVPAALDLEGETLALRFERVRRVDGGFTFTSAVRAMPLAGGGSTLLAEATGHRDRGGYSGTFLQGIALDGGLVHWAREAYEAPVEGDGTFDLLRAPAGGGVPLTLDRDGRLYAEPGNSLRDFDVTGGTILYATGEFATGFLARVDAAASFR